MTIKSTLFGRTAILGSLQPNTWSRLQLRHREAIGVGTGWGGWRGSHQWAVSALYCQDQNPIRGSAKVKLDFLSGKEHIGLHLVSTWSPQVITTHHLVDPSYPPVKQKRTFTPKRNKIINEEVDWLLEVGHIREVLYPSWIANTIVVLKKGGKWRVSIEYTDLNKTVFPTQK